MTTESLRHRIRALTDALPRGQWLKLPEILQQVPDTIRGTLAAELSMMVKLGYLIRRGRPKLYEYRSGPNPIVDRRLLRRGKPMEHRKSRGFMALARLQRENPAEWARLTDNGKI